MLDINLLAVGPIKEKSYQAVISEYVKRLRPFVRLKITELAAAPFSANNQAAAKEEEGRRIRDFISRDKKLAGAAVYLLAERGREFTSPDFAAWLEAQQPLILVIGGALGFSPDLYKDYPQISLSPLTFPHELARVLLLEQIYRAAAILNKKSYHY